DKIQMTTTKIEINNVKSRRIQFDLEERTLIFAKNCIDLCMLMHKSIINNELVSQLVRSATSVGANYREANDTITEKDFYHRIGICRREAKECKYWIELVLHSNVELKEKALLLIDEALQLTRIFAAISNKK
ncbi:MAG: four helix bundle protein, partial [Candidatus Omnitrophica bacterium]|nr:four helix bundle protein [Candidatus Omnitrophota bacterium]